MARTNEYVWINAGQIYYDNIFTRCITKQINYKPKSGRAQVLGLVALDCVIVCRPLFPNLDWPGQLFHVSHDRRTSYMQSEHGKKKLAL